ncbi:metallophosphoesterase [Ruegeria sp. 2012CJ41-6]|uniref:Metallophosphoesterase n=1 Tax=Ruegeria spongiae TaxID=2942209 RepID=A0ABT0Q7S3_9RHOB|nr:metallophosphoesterase [Ruegeria spongiae]MCL6285847.1 metallophosphoesterase [Ruegeria spongiae]
MKRFICFFLGASLLACLGLAGTRGQVFSIAGSTLRQLSTPMASDLFDADRIHDVDVTEPFSLLAGGDIANCKKNSGVERGLDSLRYSIGLPRDRMMPNAGMVATAKILQDHPLLPVLALGDLAYKHGEPVSFSDCYDPYWGQARTRTWPTPGNHEYESLNAYGYFDYWGQRAGPDRQGYYAIRSKNWLILSLNSEIDASDGSDQMAWLQGVLTKHPEKCLAAFYHKPAYSAVNRKHSENARHLFRVLQNADATFVLNGHNHFYERTHQLDGNGRPSSDGTTTFVVGAGGKTTEGPVSATEVTAKLITGVPGVLKLDFLSDSVGWDYLSEPAHADQDSGSLRCLKPKFYAHGRKVL